ncbi:MAG: hypothetical protein ACUZ8H_09700 [Candidatus Anammoxibacter sp.]
MVYIKAKGSTTRNVANLGNIKRFNAEDIEKYALSDEVEIVESLKYGSIIFGRKISKELDKLFSSKPDRRTIAKEHVCLFALLKFSFTLYS